MRRFLLASAASLAMVCGASSILAQAPATTTTSMTAEQKADYDTWPADQRTSYDSWPADQQAYYWSLTAKQRTGWWALTDQQRQQLLAMDPATRVAAWASIEKQLAAAPGTPMAGSAPGTRSSAQTADAAGAASAPPDPAAQPYKGALNEPPAADMNKTYPPCSKTVQDNCRNRGGV